MDDIDEFVDASSEFIPMELDVESGVAEVANESFDVDEMAALDNKQIFDELGLMINSTLASDFDGANALRLNAHF